MLVDIQTYLSAIFTNAQEYKDLITIDHKIGMMKYIFSRQNIDINSIPDQVLHHIQPYFNEKENIMLMNKVLNNEVNINDIVFDNVEKITIVGQFNNHILYNAPIKVKDLLVAVFHVTHKTDKFVEVINIHEVPYTNELVITLDHGDTL